MYRSYDLLYSISKLIFFRYNLSSAQGILDLLSKSLVWTYGNYVWQRASETILPELLCKGRIASPRDRPLQSHLRWLLPSPREFSSTWSHLRQALFRYEFTHSPCNTVWLHIVGQISCLGFAILCQRLFSDFLQSVSASRAFARAPQNRY